MKLCTMILCATALLTGWETSAQHPTNKHEQSIAAIRKLGAEVRIDPNSPGQPVAVILTGTARPTDCLPYLEGIRNLQTCDL
jgi:hypothetical protein